MLEILHFFLIGIKHTCCDQEGVVHLGDKLPGKSQVMDRGWGSLKKGWSRRKGAHLGGMEGDGGTGASTEDSPGSRTHEKGLRQTPSRP